MAVVRPFCAVRPAKSVCSQVAALPYDVYNRQEAAEVVKNAPYSFLNIDRPETQFAPDQDMYADEVYEKAASMLKEWIEKGIFIRENEACYYIYRLIMDGRSQSGIVGCSSIDDYKNQVIKKHENTRREKEEDRVRHVDTCSAQTGPIFLAYRQKPELKALVEDTEKEEPVYDFTSEDGIRHTVWVVKGKEKTDAFYEAFINIPNTYIADGHHRAASAVRVGFDRREKRNGAEGEADYFLSVLFPDEELMIMPYNRVVMDLNGKSEKEFMDELKTRGFSVKKADKEVMPEKKGTFGMYLNHSWYLLEAGEAMLSSDPVDGLDVSILQNELLEPVLGIKDPRIDKRIDFVGGIRGLKELERRVEEENKKSGQDDKNAVAFSMYPTSISELFEVADHGLLMPPKSTWFEPKLRSGLFIHEI